MGQTSHSFQLSSTTLCEHYCWQKRELRRKSKPRASVGIENRLLGKLSASHTAAPLPCYLGYPRIIVCSESSVVANATGRSSSVNHGASREFPEYDQYKASNPPNSAANVCMSLGPLDGATTFADGVPSERGHSNALAPSSPSSSYVDHTENLVYPSSGATSDVLSSTNQSNTANSPSIHVHDDADDNVTGSTHDAITSSIPPNAGEKEEKGKIRRFSLNEPGLLKTLQEAKALTPLEKDNLDKIMNFKLTNGNLKGRLVIRAVRTEHMKDLENLLTDSYAELMWGPLTYKPVLAWILSTYLRERQACLPHAVTLVGLYEASEETKVEEGSAPKWWLAGAVEISFNASGKPKDMQTPLPPEDIPFLGNMAVLKKFRRRGIGRELLKAAEDLALEMGGIGMYLHCRMVDEAPLNMYKSSGYSVVETNSIVSLLLFQRRRHLMYKRLAAPVHE